MTKKELAEKVIEALAPQIEVIVEKAVADHTDKVIDLALEKLTTLIPGTLDNVLAASIAPKLKEEVKAILLAKAELISDKV